MIIRFFKSLINGFRWFAFGFDDIDWDSYFFYYLLLYKLRRMKKCLCKGITREYVENKNNELYVDALRKLRKVIIWLKQLVDDKPFSIVRKYLKKYPLNMKTDKLPTFTVTKVVYNKNANLKYQNKLFKRCYLIYKKETEKLIKNIFDTIRDYHRLWSN